MYDLIQPRAAASATRADDYMFQDSTEGGADPYRRDQLLADISAQCGEINAAGAAVYAQISAMVAPVRRLNEMIEELGALNVSLGMDAWSGIQNLPLDAAVHDIMEFQYDMFQ